VFGELLPERRRVDDGDSLHLAEAQEIGVGTDDVVGAAGHGALEELVVGGIAAHADHDLWTDEHGPTSDSQQHRARLMGRGSEFSQDVRTRSDRVDLGEDRLGDEQEELVGAPRLIKASGEAPGAGECAPQEDLGVKNGFERGQRVSPRR